MTLEKNLLVKKYDFRLWKKNLEVDAIQLYEPSSQINCIYWSRTKGKSRESEHVFF